MSDDEFDPETEEAREIAAEAGEESSEFLSLLPHYYRGEVGQMATRLDRLDLTTDWAIGLIAAVLGLSFASADSPPYLLLIGMLALTIFLLFDIRRYRSYDAARARVRMIEENVFANAFDPAGAVHEDWRTAIASDLRTPTLKVSARETVTRRLRRVYFPLLSVLLVAWLFRITFFVPEESWRETATVPGVPASTVVTVVGLYYLALLVVTAWPNSRQAMGEFHDEEPGEWKTDE
ncbi:DUF2270 domain-containing protein [Natrononativus amylolyticus]|uniref:DUF2270 domain-containing protein n=1 Tax=Natrononativus amylolyticus TaxID=2963434 RepID=UPI0020CDA80A|nr:DUF2270 domain-containing protein [Natrononativus amylolyticus]